MAFNVNNRSLKFAGHLYPDIELMKNILSVSKDEQYEIIRQYFTEGVPSAFSKNPVLYEKIRTFLGGKIGVNAKSISITGSARIGYSLSPIGNKFGRQYDEKKSDLDFFAVDANLFNNVSADFNLFVQWLNSPTNTNVNMVLLRENERVIAKSILNGFIDQDKIPDLINFPTVKSIYSSLRELLRIMGDTKNCPQPKKTSIRIYKDWNSCIKRITLNITDALEKS